MFSFLPHSQVFVNCVKAASELTRDEQIALTRDHLARENPDELLYGFIPVWAIVIYVISGVCFVLAIVSALCYVAGCRNPQRGERLASFD